MDFLIYWCISEHLILECPTPRALHYLIGAIWYIFINWWQNLNFYNYLYIYYFVINSFMGPSQKDCKTLEPSQYRNIYILNIKMHTSQYLFTYICSKVWSRRRERRLILCSSFCINIGVSFVLWPHFNLLKSWGLSLCFWCRWNEAVCTLYNDHFVIFW